MANTIACSVSTSWGRAAAALVTQESDHKTHRNARVMMQAFVPTDSSAVVNACLRDFIERATLHSNQGSMFNTLG
jgi:hypothetical protein